MSRLMPFLLLVLLHTSFAELTQICNCNVTNSVADSAWQCNGSPGLCPRNRFCRVPRGAFTADFIESNICHDAATCDVSVCGGMEHILPQAGQILCDGPVCTSEECCRNRHLCPPRYARCTHGQRVNTTGLCRTFEVDSCTNDDCCVGGFPSPSLPLHVPPPSPPSPSPRPSPPSCRPSPSAASRSLQCCCNHPNSIAASGWTCTDNRNGTCGKNRFCQIPPRHVVLSADYLDSQICRDGATCDASICDESSDLVPHAQQIVCDGSHCTVEECCRRRHRCPPALNRCDPWQSVNLSGLCQTFEVDTCTKEDCCVGTEHKVTAHWGSQSSCEWSLCGLSGAATCVNGACTCHSGFYASSAGTCRNEAAQAILAEDYDPRTVFKQLQLKRQSPVLFAVAAAFATVVSLLMAYQRQRDGGVVNSYRALEAGDSA